MEIVAVIALAAIIVGLVLWARHVFKKHEEEAIYEPGEGSDAHKRDPTFQAQLADRLGGGGGF